MDDLLSEIQGRVLLITLNRIHKHNAFNDEILTELQHLLDQAETDPNIRVIILKANGRHFSAGADLAWMQRMAHFSEEENIDDAKILARLMFSFYHHPKPTIAMIQGAAFGGGAGLVAACDIAVAAQSALFCFSEVKLGLIPAVISPYVVRAIGERAAINLFTSAETFDAKRALQLNLVHYCVPEEELLTFTLNHAQQIAQLAPEAVSASKRLVSQVAGHPIDETLQHITAKLIAKKRVSAEGQRGLQAFLNKEIPNWNE